MKISKILRRERRLIALLGGVVLLLLLILLLTRSCGKEEEAEDPESASGAGTAGAGSLITSGDELSAMEYFNGTATLSFAKDPEGKWYWTQDAEFPLDETYPAAVAAALQDLTASATIASGEGDTLESYGLDSSDLYVKTTTVTGVTSTLLIGNKLDTGEYYIRFEDEETVYVVGAALMDAASKSINDMVIPETFPTLDETTITSFTIAGTGESTLTYTVKELGENSYGWYKGSVDVSTDSTVTALREELAALAFDACVTYRPSDEALEICGITDPQATLTVAYRTEDTEEDATLTLYIGNLRDDGATYFASLAPDGAIYSISHDTVRNILFLAESLSPAEEETGAA